MTVDPRQGSTMLISGPFLIAVCLSQLGEPTPKGTPERPREYDAHVAAVRQRPWDERAITDLARWLDGTDEPRARLVRLQLRRSQAPIDEPKRKELNDEIAKLEKGHRARWAKALDRLGDRAEITFEVGLIDSIELRAAEDADIEALANVPELRSVRLAGPKLTRAGFDRLGRFPNLDELTIEEALAPDRLTPLEQLPPWTVVRVTLDKQNRDAFAKLNARRIAKLGKLSPAEKHSAGVRFLRAIGANPAPFGKPLTGAGLGQSGIDDAQMQLLAHLPELESVYISESDVTTAGVAHLAGLKRLKSLTLFQTRVTSITALAGLTELEALRLFPDSDVQMGDAGLAVLEKFPKLQDLYLNDDAAGADTVQRLAGLTKLHRLDLTLPALQGDESLAALAKLTDLRTLSLHGGKVSDGGLEHLAGLKRLESLDIRVAAGPGAGFRHLAGLDRLRYLYVNGDGVTDLGMEQLRGLTGLRSIMAQGSAVSEKGARQLAARLPRVTIILDKAVVKTPTETVTLRRQRFQDTLSVALPADWNVDPDRTRGDDIHAREDGWERIGGWSSAVVGPAEILVYGDDAAKSAKAAMTARIEINAHLNPKVLKADVHAVAGSAETASCIFRNDYSQSLVCVAKVGKEYVVLICSAPPARFPEFEKLFLAVAKSVRVSDDAKAHADETVTLKAESLKPK
jgi:hypothetical protein